MNALLRGVALLGNRDHRQVAMATRRECAKRPFRSDVINYLLGQFAAPHTRYLEIGVRNPNHNFNKIHAQEKYSVDPGVEYQANPVDFQLTSDAFFAQLTAGKILTPDVRFQVIFIDGLHLAEQVERDIQNSLRFIADDGFILLHDCNPPTPYHAREDYDYRLSPAGEYWNGTTWKAFYRSRLGSGYTSCCIDSDWGVGVLTKLPLFSQLSEDINPYLEFDVLDQRRKESMNLLSFAEFKQAVEAGTLHNQRET